MALLLLAVVAVRENVFRAEFDQKVYFSRVQDAKDASRTDHWAVTPVAGTSGLDGNPARPVSVVDVALPTEVDGIPEADVGRFVDVVVDRPMSPFPSYYDFAATNVWDEDLIDQLVAATVQVPATYRLIEPPSIDQPSPTRDIANAQTLAAARDSLPDPTDPLSLGTIQVDDTGDYAFDEGNANLKKRVIRRLVTRKNGFAHLPGYGVGVPDYGKRLAIPSIVTGLAADAEAQIGLEPDVAKVKVAVVSDPNVPGLTRLRTVVKPKAGPPQRYDVPFPSE